ncbi:DedA family protein [Paenibacillus piri]|uniref:DedA family protein n=1 Tax=Paenibacillus piri TaxID=2547395 RepID=A0A4R5KHJ5_9BACL|nr:DedA family protein [Paenibacillus piri]TDF94816.1 DedA family protein [Paenibacillus piri]
MEWISTLFGQYGYFVLFFGLFAESLALPFPGELAMAVSGHMTNLGSFQIPYIVALSYLGAIAGTTVTYYLGYRLGTPFFEKYGKYFFMTRDRRLKVTRWFDQYGDKLILISYFIPGLRHFTGYVSGMLRVRLRTFLIYNYIGGLLWVLTYVTVGVVFGQKIEQWLHLISRYSVAAIVIALLGLAIGYAIKQNKAALAAWLRTMIRGTRKGSPENDR